MQIADALTGNLLMLAAGTTAVFLSNRPLGLRVQRYLTGTATLDGFDVEAYLLAAGVSATDLALVRSRLLG